MTEKGFLGPDDVKVVNRLIERGRAFRLPDSAIRTIGYGAFSRDFDGIVARLAAESAVHIHTEKDNLSIDAFELKKPLYKTVNMVELVEVGDNEPVGVSQIHYTISAIAFDRVESKLGDQPVKSLHNFNWKKILVDGPDDPHIKVRDHTVIDLFQAIAAEKGI